MQFFCEKVACPENRRSHKKSRSDNCTAKVVRFIENITPRTIFIKFVGYPNVVVENLINFFEHLINAMKT